MLGETALGATMLGETTLGATMLGVAAKGLTQPQDNVGDENSSLMIGAANCNASSEPPFVFCNKLATIINCNVFAKFLQAVGEQSVMIVVELGAGIGTNVL